jgi:hypothetical protein
MAEYFWNRVEKRGATECWPWIGIRDHQGYGVFPYKAKMYRAPRFLLEVTGTIIPKGYYACHKCDNPSCVNPSHVYAGTPQENSNDKIQRKRQPMGSNCSASKLNEEQVIQIRIDSRRTEVIAEEYGVSCSNIGFIKSRKTWRHI